MAHHKSFPNAHRTDQSFLSQVIEAAVCTREDMTDMDSQGPELKLSHYKQTGDCVDGLEPTPNRGDEITASQAPDDENSVTYLSPPPPMEEQEQPEASSPETQEQEATQTGTAAASSRITGTSAKEAPMPLMATEDTVAMDNKSMDSSCEEIEPSTAIPLFPGEIAGPRLASASSMHSDMDAAETKFTEDVQGAPTKASSIIDVSKVPKGLEGDEHYTPTGSDTSEVSEGGAGGAAKVFGNKRSIKRRLFVYAFLLVLVIVGLVFIFVAVDIGNRDESSSLAASQNGGGVSSSALPSSPPTDLPTSSPTLEPSMEPSLDPTASPTGAPTAYPTKYPTGGPTGAPTSSPTNGPTGYPTGGPTEQPSTSPSTALTTLRPVNMSPAPTPSFLPPDDPDATVTYFPGKLSVSEAGLLLSEGLTARIIARTGQRVNYANGDRSSIDFHVLPDAAAIFEDTRPGNPGGYVYASNSEHRTRGQGGVGAVTFNADGGIIDYRMVLTGTGMNCGGGRTPWNTWVSCEELFDNGEGSGNIYQVDPLGERQGEITSVGSGLGRFESFTYDVRDRNIPRFFASEDRRRGAVRRFTPHETNWDDPWQMLHGEGKLDYLVLTPDPNDDTKGTFQWVDDLMTAKLNAANHYPECEGIDVDGNLMYLVSKRWRTMWVFDLDAQTYERESTQHGAFDGRPDQVNRLLDQHGTGEPESTILYFTEEGGEHCGVHGRNGLGQFFTILESINLPDETTGIDFSPDGRRMYVCFQDNGLLYEIRRTDGLPFYGRTVDIKYHNVNPLLS